HADPGRAVQSNGRRSECPRCPWECWWLPWERAEQSAGHIRGSRLDDANEVEHAPISALHGVSLPRVRATHPRAFATRTKHAVAWSVRRRAEHRASHASRRRRTRGVLRRCRHWVSGVSSGSGLGSKGLTGVSSRSRTTFGGTLEAIRRRAEGRSSPESCLI